MLAAVIAIPSMQQAHSVGCVPVKAAKLYKSDADSLCWVLLCSLVKWRIDKYLYSVPEDIQNNFAAIKYFINAVIVWYKNQN